jgi:mevalonate kinase
MIYERHSSNGQHALKARTPAKLILSGEHAVVYGCPALAIAINRYTDVTIRWKLPLSFSFDLMGIHFRQRLTQHALRRLKDKLKNKYEQYSLGHLSIKEVLQHPFELALFTFINVLDRLPQKVPMGIDIFTHSNIPVGCGLGSSAASVVSLIYALAHFLKLDLPLDDYIRLGIESENLQHGLSSGLDVHTVYHGGYLYYQKGQLQQQSISNQFIDQLHLQLVETGKPLSTTGECVAHAVPYFNDSGIRNDFSTTTQALHDAMQKGHKNEIQEHIRHNHQLLRTINVVPNKAHQFITEIEKQGGAAKVCGAGSIYGDAAGVLLVMTDQDISSLAKEYDYQTSQIQLETRGTHLV